MRKILLTTTLIAVTAVSTNAWSFGGLGILGHKSSHKGGVNAIGVHIDTNNKEQPNIDIRTCDSETEELVGSECCKKTLIYTDNDTTKCCSLEGYAVQDGKCKKQCGEGLVLNEETNECEDACPAERQCGDTCCGEGNVCHHEDDAYQCCNEDWGECCDISTSTGYSTKDHSCCETGLMPVAVAYTNNESTKCCPIGSSGYTDADGCCGANDTQIFSDVKKNAPHCCPSNSTGYALDDGCCPPGTISDDFNCCPENSWDWDNEQCIQ